MRLASLKAREVSLRAATAAAAATLVMLAAPGPAPATTVSVEGPLGTTITTPPLDLGPPGQPGALDGQGVTVPGLVNVTSTPAPTKASPNSPVSRTPAPSTAPASSGAAARDTQPSNADSRRRSAASGTRSRKRNGSAARSSRRPASGGPSASTGNRAAIPRRSTGGSEPVREARRRSVARRIVDRVPTGYRLALLGVLALAAGFALAGWRERRRALRAEAEALVDPLTGLANRRAFDRRLAEEWKRSERYGRPLGLVMLDLDGFKRLNDTRGHKEGDRVLREVASLITHRLREIDLVARLGGDEFAAICPETPTEGLEALTRSLEAWLERLPVGASIGYAAREAQDDNPLDLLERADAAMYMEKRDSVARESGRRRLTRL
jgi:diguanylate cyclase (GGDEF)-like protein